MFVKCEKILRRENYKILCLGTVSKRSQRRRNTRGKGYPASHNGSQSEFLHEGWPRRWRSQEDSGVTGSLFSPPTAPFVLPALYGAVISVGTGKAVQGRFLSRQSSRWHWGKIASVSPKSESGLAPHLQGHE